MISIQALNHRGGVGPQLGEEGKGVCPVPDFAPGGGDAVFVPVPRLWVRGGQHPDAAVQPLHRPGVPDVEVADQRNHLCLWSIDGKAHLRLVVFPDKVRAEQLIAPGGASAQIIDHERKVNHTIFLSKEA